MSSPEAFFKAIESGDVATVRSMLEASPDLVNATDQYGSRPIFAATLSEHPAHVEIVKVLLEKGADVNDPTNTYPKQHTPLHFAVARYDVPLVKLLLEKGANPNLRNSAQSTPLFGVGNFLNVIPPASAFRTKTADQYFGERFAMAKELVALLIGRGAQIDVKNWFGKTPLSDMHPDLQEFAKAAAIQQVRQEKRGLAEVSVKKGIPQSITGNISSFLDPQGKPPAQFLPGSSSSSSSNAASGKGRKTRMRKTKKRRTLRKHKWRTG